MLGRTFSKLTMALLFISMIMLGFNLRLARADAQTVHINADGSIDPSGAPIVTSDNVTYILSGNISYPTYLGIAVERNDVVIDGKGFTLQGFGSGNGIDVTSAYNVTIRNVNIMYFFFGIYLHDSNNNSVLSNNITETSWAGVELDYSQNNFIRLNNISTNEEYYSIDLNNAVNNTISENEIEGLHACIRLANSNDTNISENNEANGIGGMWLLYSSNNIIFGNNVRANNAYGIDLDYSPNNSIIGNSIVANGVYGVLLNGGSSNCVVSENDIRNNSIGIGLSDSSNNSMCANNIEANQDGIFLFGFSGSINNSIFANNITANAEVGMKFAAFNNSLRNTIFHNNFANNKDHVFFVDNSCVNTWTDGYPFGGNFWSDYNGTDLYSGPYQNMTGSDGIGDTPYVIDSNNTDYYPLMKPYPTYIHDVALTDIEADRSLAYQGWPVNINVTVKNKGDFDETSVKITLYYDIASLDVVGTQIVSLLVGESRTITFTWKTTDVSLHYDYDTRSYRRYTITAVVSMSADNNPTNTISTTSTADGNITVRMMGDVNEDGKVDVKDITALARAFGTDTGMARWNPDLDLNMDGRIDVRDVTIDARHFGNTLGTS